MTLRDFFEFCAENPLPFIVFFTGLPMLALIWGLITKKEKVSSPQRYGFSALIFLSSIPGITALVFALYLFFFERQSIWDTNLIMQILPIFSMVLTLGIIKNFIPYEFIPGFDKISQMLSLLLVIIAGFWIMDKTHIYVISFFPFYMVFFLIIGLYFLIRFLFKKIV